MSIEGRNGPENDSQPTVQNIGLRILHESGAEAVIRYVNAPRFDSDVGADFKAQAYFGIAKEGLWDEEVDTDEAMYLLDELTEFDNPSHDDMTSWANDVAGVGKYLAQDERFVTRGQQVLKKAASMFERFYTAMGAEPLSIRAQVLIDDYCRVASLQDEAGDSTGGRQTSQIIAPHLVALVKEINEDETAYDRVTLESQLNSTIHHLGDLGSEEARYLYRNIRNENIRHVTLGVLLEHAVGDLIAVGEVGRGLAILKAGEGTPLSVWSEAMELWRNDEQQTVQTLIDKVEEVFPDFYEKADAVVTSLTPMVEILDIAGRDVLLETVFRSMITADEDLTPMHRFAYRCGFNQKSERLQAITKPLEMRQELVVEVYESYQMGVDAAAKETSAD